jgi:hypothetical protein
VLAPLLGLRFFAHAGHRPSISQQPLIYPNTPQTRSR